jgi:hypothetical protein
MTTEEIKRALIDDPTVVHEILAAILPAAEALTFRLDRPTEGRMLVNAVSNFGSRRDVERWHYNEG